MRPSKTLTAKEIASITYEIRLGANLMQAVGGHGPTADRIHTLRRKNQAINDLFSRAEKARAVIWARTGRMK